jgi:hypothetical protein
MAEWLKAPVLKRAKDGFLAYLMVIVLQCALDYEQLAKMQERLALGQTQRWEANQAGTIVVIPKLLATGVDVAKPNNRSYSASGLP